MLYVKVLGTDGDIISAEAHADPVYVCYQKRNGITMRCSNVKAQGLISLDLSQTYNLQGREKLPGKHLTAEEISKADYEQLVSELEIPEQPETPGDVTDDGADTNIITAAELRETVTTLKQTVEFLEDCLLEMSEVIYG